MLVKKIFFAYTAKALNKYFVAYQTEQCRPVSHNLWKISCVLQRDVLITGHIKQS